MEFNINLATLLIFSAVSACSSSSATPTGYKIDASTSAVAGDAVPLSVVQTMSDGSTAALPTGASVAWSAPSTVTALDPGSAEDSPLPALGDDPTAVFLDNPGRPDSDLNNVLFVLGAGKAGGTLTVSADISGVTPVAHATTSIAVTAAPDGDATRGATLFVANCAVCHGSTGHGSPANADGTSFTLEGKSYDFPAPGLNSEDGNAAGDPDWNAALFAVASRADFDDGAVSLQAPMPAWLSEKGSTGKLLTTQDFADMFAFLATQSQ